MTDREQFAQQVRERMGDASAGEAMALADLLIERGHVMFDPRNGYDIEQTYDMTEAQWIELMNEAVS